MAQKQSWVKSIKENIAEERERNRMYNPLKASVKPHGMLGMMDDMTQQMSAPMIPQSTKEISVPYPEQYRGVSNFLSNPNLDSGPSPYKATKDRQARQKLLEDPENELDRNEMDSEALDEWHQDQASDKKEKMDAITKVEGPDQMDEMISQMEIEEPGMLSKAGDYISGLFSSDDKEDVEGRKAFGKALLGKATGVPEPSGGGQMRMAEARTTGGKVAFPGLLNKPQRQRTPYFMPKGLV